ncbi:transposase [Rhodocytophaga rosea]|uniref:transposase n=1 Tax=Rhodocytophaga rosea TaxID=2704465 RepID=UPI003742A10F
MPQGRRKFDKEFKLMTVELSKSRTDYGQLARELDISPDLIYRWRKEYLDKKEGGFPGHGKPKLTAQEAEIALLKKQLRVAELERDMEPMLTT